MALIELGIAAVIVAHSWYEPQTQSHWSCQLRCGRSLLRSGKCKLRRELQVALRRMTDEVLRLAALLKLQAGYLWRKSGIWRD